MTWSAWPISRALQASTLEAKARLEKVSAAWTATGATLQNMSAFESPPSESCSSIVSFEFLQQAATCADGLRRCASYAEEPQLHQHVSGFLDAH